MQIRKLPFDSSLVAAALVYWRSTILFQVVFTLIYFGIFITLLMFVFNYYGITQEMNALSAYFGGDMKVLEQKYLEIISTENFQNASLWTIGIGAVLWPLNLGMFAIYAKIDRKEIITPRDLFAGYEGSSFFKFFGYGLLWNAFYFLSKSFVVLAPVLVVLTLFVGPLLFLAKCDLRNSLRLGIKAVIKNPQLSIAIFFIGFFISYSGLLLCVFGVVFTYPFWNALLYVVYKKMFLIENKI